MFPMDPQTLSWSDNTTLSLSIIKLEQSVASIPSQNNVFFSNFPTALITGWMSWGRKYFNFFPTLEAVKYLWISGTSYNLLFKCLRYLSRRNFKWLNLMGRTFTQLNEAKAVLKLIHGFSTWVVMLTLYNYVSMMIKNFDDPTVNIDENTSCFYFNHFSSHVWLLQDWTVTIATVKSTAAMSMPNWIWAICGLFKHHPRALEQCDIARHDWPDSNRQILIQPWKESR